MIDKFETCFANAEAARSDAGKATLDHVRNMHLSSAKAWENLALILQGDACYRAARPARPSAKVRPTRSSVDRWENEGGNLARTIRGSSGQSPLISRA